MCAPNCLSQARDISGTFSNHETNITSVAAAKKKHNFERGRTYFKLRPGYPQYPVADAPPPAQA
jgi:hypothetical protein